MPVTRSLAWIRQRRCGDGSVRCDLGVDHGPIAAAELSNPGKRSGNWWGWGGGKATLEHLYNSGLVAIAGRRGFERLYDIAKRVIPPAALAAPAPPPEEAKKQLICLGAKACCVGTL